MDISLSKFTKKNIFSQISNPQCKLFNFSVIQQTVIYRRESTSKKKSQSYYKNKSSCGIGLTYRKQQQQLEKQLSTKSNSIQNPSKIQTNMNTILNGKSQINLDKQQNKKINIRLFQDDQKQKKQQMYHGSWGIPKYLKPSTPGKQIKRFPITTQCNIQKQMNKLPLKIQKYQKQNPEILNSFKLKLPEKIIQNRQINIEQKYQKQSKILNSTRISKSEQQVWYSILKQPTQTPTTKTLFIPQTPPKIIHNLNSVKSQTLTIPKMISQTSRVIASKSYSPISKLEEARQAKSVVSGDLSNIHSRQLDTHKFEEHSIPLKQSIVLASDINQVGFWN